MAIEVRHGNPGAISAAAFAGGQGTARQRAQEGLARSLGQEEAQKRALRARSAEAAAQRQFSRESQIRNIQAQDYLAGRATERRRGDLEHRLTTVQEHELEGLADAEAKIMASSDFTDDEKDEARRRIAAKRAGIQPVERPRPKTRVELFKDNNVMLPNGSVIGLEDGGVPGKTLFEPPPRQLTPQDRIAAFDKLLAQSRVIDPKTGKETVDPVLYQENLQRMKDMGVDFDFREASGRPEASYGEQGVEQAYRDAASGAAPQLPAPQGGAFAAPPAPIETRMLPAPADREARIDAGIEGREYVAPQGRAARLERAIQDLDITAGENQRRMAEGAVVRAGRSEVFEGDADADTASGMREAAQRRAARYGGASSPAGEPQSQQKLKKQLTPYQELVSGAVDQSTIPANEIKNFPTADWRLKTAAQALSEAEQRLMPPGPGASKEDVAAFAKRYTQFLKDRDEALLRVNAVRGRMVELHVKKKQLEAEEMARRAAARMGQ